MRARGGRRLAGGRAGGGQTGAGSGEGARVTCPAGGWARTVGRLLLYWGVSALLPGLVCLVSPADLARVADWLWGLRRQQAEPGRESSGG